MGKAYRVLNKKFSILPRFLSERREPEPMEKDFLRILSFYM
jgi:hypothetical protein